ncbi:MAG TPA: PorV/PorQ family protein [Candidatus Goldiibacteriota bacterium]|nr:PorV/PorQ family protein [Candidatus Goldiibacteriota bacterium]
MTGEFMLTAVPAREAALGNIFAANYAKPSAATANPAALAGIKKAHIMLSHFMNVFNTFFEQIIYASPLSEKSWLQGYFMFSGNYDVYITDGEGNPVAQADSYDALLGAAYAFELTKDISLGLNARVVTGKSYAAANWGLALNAGFLYRNFDRRYMIGLSAENLGISTAYFVDQSMYPVVLRAGYNTEIYRYEESYRISLAVEERLYVNEQEGAETTFGLEAEYERFFVFRYGYIFGKAEGRVALGAGIKFKHINIDYAYQPYFFSDNAHRFTLEFVF